MMIRNLKPLLISYGHVKQLSENIESCLNRGRLTFSGKLFSSTNVIFPSCDLSIKLNSLNYPQKTTKLSVKSKVININNACLLLHPNFMLLSIWVYTDLAECCFQISKTWQSLLGTLEKFKIRKFNVSSRKHCFGTDHKPRRRYLSKHLWCLIAH